MAFIAKLTAFFISALAFIISPLYGVMPCFNDYTVSIDTSVTGGEIPNVASNVNVWNMADNDIFSNPQLNSENNVFEFVEYVQLMQCTGGSADRDLFKDPLDFDTLDDYDFTKLIENCRGILSLGAKPHLKLGSVPLKYSALARTDTTYGTNPYPPDDYNVYYDYIYNIGLALADEFGKEEVLSWRFGVMTEYENAQWFFAADGTPESSAEAYCRLYDYTVDALQKSIGEDIFVGAHSMTVSEGLWDEKIFIEHCAKGTNYKTGETGSRICFLSASFYDMKPGEFTSGKTLPETIGYLQQCAAEAGLSDLIFGIDEGRIYGGINAGKAESQLLSRTVGYCYQAAYDARLYKQLVDIGGDYLSSWYYLSGGLFEGNPTLSYHVASSFAKFAGMNTAETEIEKKGLLLESEIDCMSAYDEETNSVLIMAYNFKNELEYSYAADMKFNLNLPQLDGRDVEIRVYKIDDSCNYFDEWVEDRKTYGITDDCFAWSPDCPVIESTATLADAHAREIYFTELRDKYAQCSTLSPTVINATIKNGSLTLAETVEPNGVLFIEIIPAD